MTSAGHSQMTSGTGVVCRWRTALKQQGTDNSEGIWFTPLSPTLINEDGMGSGTSAHRQR